VSEKLPLDISDPRFQTSSMLTSAQIIDVLIYSSDDYQLASVILRFDMILISNSFAWYVANIKIAISFSCSRQSVFLLRMQKMRTKNQGPNETHGYYVYGLAARIM